MKKLLVLALLGVASFSQALTFDFVSDGNPGAKIQFNGTNKTFNFAPASTGYDFVIRSSDNASLIGLQGNFRGIFQIGTITTTGGLQTAPVTGLGSMTIFDGTNTLSADIVWNSIFSFGTVVGLNDIGLPNVTNVNYSGSNSGLNQLMNEVQRTANLSTQFIPSRSLTQLTTANAFNEATYSGTYTSVVPEPASMIALGGLALVAMRRKRNSK